MKQRKQGAELESIGGTLQGFQKLYLNPIEEEPNNSESGRLVWAEPQLFLLPLCVPQDKTADRFRNICITEKVRVGEVLKERIFRVNADPLWGLPGPFELEVMGGIYQIAEEYKARGESPIELDLGSLRSFLDRLGRPMSGNYAAMLKDAVKRLAATICISEGFFYSKARDLYLVESFTFLTGVKIAGETDFNGVRHQKTTVRLHEFIRENLDSNFRTLIDFEFLRSLKTDIAKPLSLHAAYRFFKNGNSCWEADYDWLANRMAIRVYEDVKRAKDQLRPALHELKNRSFLADYQWLPNRRVRFIAGPKCVELHTKRVASKDAWLLHQERESRQLQLIPRTPREAEKLQAFDPLATLCTEYAANGWTSSVAQKARLKQVSEEIVRQEAITRGHFLKPRQ